MKGLYGRSWHIGRCWRMSASRCSAQSVEKHDRKVSNSLWKRPNRKAGKSPFNYTRVMLGSRRSGGLHRTYLLKAYLRPSVAALAGPYTSSFGVACSYVEKEIEAGDTVSFD